MRVVYRTRMFKNLSLGRKWHHAEVGLRRLGAPTQWHMLKRKFRARTKAEEYGPAFMERFQRLKDAAE
jgi:hypothetical protein